MIDSVLENAKRLAEQVNPGAANDAGKRRDYERILNNCLAGLLSEQLWKAFLNRTKPTVSETDFDSAKTQIDLRVEANGKKIEVRSSFPRNGIEFALCSSTHEFDVIGMYTNGYKPDEVQKDFYVRALYHLKKIGEQTVPSGKTVAVVEKLLDKAKQDGFEAWLTGGATWGMMTDDEVAINKDFIPEDELNMIRLGAATSYRVVPFSRALDSVEIENLVLAEC